MFNWFKKKPPLPPPAYWSDYLATKPARAEGDLLTQRFVCFDTETTGLDPQQDKLLSIGAVAVQGWQMDLADSYEAFVGNDNHGSRGAQAVAIHGILPTAHQGDVTEAQAVAGFVAYIGNAVLVGHHVAFDVAMVNQHLSRNYGLKLRNRTLDTARMARRLDGKLREATIGQPYALDKMCERFQIPAHDRHNAAGDAYITAILFLKLRHRLASRGVDSLPALLK